MVEFLVFYPFKGVWHNYSKLPNYSSKELCNMKDYVFQIWERSVQPTSRNSNLMEPMVSLSRVYFDRPLLKGKSETICVCFETSGWSRRSVNSVSRAWHVCYFFLWGAAYQIAREISSPWVPLNLNISTLVARIFLKFETRNLWYCAALLSYNLAISNNCAIPL